MLFKAKKLILDSGNALVVVLHKEDAETLGVHAMDRVLISCKNKEFIGLVNVTNNVVNKGEIGLSINVWKKEIKIRNGQTIKAQVIQRPESLNFIKNKLLGKKLNKDEIDTIIKDTVNNALSSVELAYFVASVQIHGMSINETYHLTKSMVDYGNALNFKGLTVDKHSVSGVPNNRTTLIIVPIMTSAGLTMPKLSSRAISSAAATADTMESLAPVELSVAKIKKVVEKTGGCIAWGGALNIAGADDELIKVRYSLRLDPEPLLLSSIMAKKVAAGSKRLIIDIPHGPGSKVANIEQAKKLGEKFIELSERFKIKTKIFLSNGSQPIGNGVGCNLEARDALKILRCEDDAPTDLKEKSIKMSEELLELSGKKKKLARELLESGEAWKKMREIIRAQGGKPNIKPENLKLGKIVLNVKSKKNGVVKRIINKNVVIVARLSGAPKDKEAGILLHKKTGDKVNKNETLLTIYTNSEDRLESVKNFLNKNKIIIT